MIFRRQKKPIRVEPGGVYRKAGPYNVTEVAEVVRLSDDEFGIPHVHYRVHFDHGYRDGSGEARTLALETFADRYGEDQKDVRGSDAG